MANVSADLVWQITRGYNSFLVKRNGLKLTAEPGNPTNLHNARFSGLAGKKTVDARQQGKQIVISLRKTKDQNKPNKAVRQVKVNSGNPNRVIKTAKALVEDSFYAPGSTRVLVKRIAKLARAQARANQLAAGKLSVKYGRNAKPFPFAQTAKAARKADEDMPPLVGAEAD